ncbi:putative MATE family efflux protein [Kitasatospora gansuensis]|uniref:Probable multidrug resistance protein NorM n=1 Tax=Kitasatospora gansuensis TaxID=258050 RepID=A0A7W7SGP8_9ACTN|nr:MATE family efflux transporter [Kitasatospora gansuensis]MBB4949792.1 putative MATE family efflux protein [Kitasatospora gansuensis]
MRGHVSRLAGLAWPVYVELLSGVIASIITTFWVARLGGPAVAAVTLATGIEHLLLGLVLVVSSGTSLRLSRARGAGDAAEAGRVGTTAWWLCGLGSVALAVPGALYRESVAGLFLDGQAAQLAAGYLAVAFPGLVVFFAQKVADDLFKGSGDTRTPMRTALLGNLLLFPLDPLLIFGAGPVPALGVSGAALALVASRAVALAVALALHRRVRVPGRVSVRTARQIMAAGLSFGVDFTARMAVGMVQLGLVASFGVAAVAGYGIGYRILLVATMAFYAIRQVAGIEAARRAGAGRADQLPALALDTAILAASVGAAATALCATAGGPLTELFTRDPAVVAQSLAFLRLMCLYLLPYALVVGLGGVLQAAGRGRALVLATALGFAVQLPSGYGLSRLIGVNGVWTAMAAGALTQLAAYRLLRIVPRKAPGAHRRPRSPRSTLRRSVPLTVHRTVERSGAA